MNDLRTTLLKFISNPDGTRKRGAVSRVAEYLDVHPKTVNHWIDKVWKPGRAMEKQIAEMIVQNISLEADYSRCGRPKKSEQTTAKYDRLEQELLEVEGKILEEEDKCNRLRLQSIDLKRKMAEVKKSISRGQGPKTS